MLVFGHAGITFASAVLISEGMARRGIPAWRKTNRLPDQATRPLSGVQKLSRYADPRLILVGSLLPDIIDKPVGQFIFRDTFANGRIFSHTVLFWLALSLVGIYLYRSRARTWLLALSFGTFFHLILDDMFLSPRTFLWPAYGLAFDRMNYGDMGFRIFFLNLSGPQVYIPEIIGLAIAVWFAQSAIRNRRVLTFLRYGQV